MVTKKVTVTAAEIQAQIVALQTQLEEMQTEDKKQNALATIAEKVRQAEQLIAECQKIADEAGVAFSWDSLGYGMGGWYESGEWQSSSSSC